MVMTQSWNRKFDCKTQLKSRLFNNRENRQPHTSHKTKLGKPRKEMILHYRYSTFSTVLEFGLR